MDLLSNNLVVQYFEYFQPSANFECHCNGIQKKSRRYYYEVDHFLNFQIENQESERQKSTSDCSERSCLNIRSNWVFWVVKNFHLIWISILSLKCVHPLSTTIALTPTVILIHIWVKINYSCTGSFRFQLWRRKIQKWSFLICSSTSNQNMKSRFYFFRFSWYCVWSTHRPPTMVQVTVDYDIQTHEGVG